MVVLKVELRWKSCSRGAESGLAVINCAGGDDGGLAVKSAAAEVLMVELR